MKTFKPTLLAVTLIVMLSSTALAGNIGGMRSAGNIGGTRSAGNIAGLRTSGTTTVGTARGSSRLDLESTFSETLTGLIRMLLESGSLL